MSKEFTREKVPVTATQIVGTLQEHEAGIATKDICRKHGISPATFYGWKAKYGGIEVSAQYRRLENGGLKKLYDAYSETSSRAGGSAAIHPLSQTSEAFKRQSGTTPISACFVLVLLG